MVYISAIASLAAQGWQAKLDSYAAQSQPDASFWQVLDWAQRILAKGKAFSGMKRSSLGSILTA